mgnify:CR=1 FL=1
MVEKIIGKLISTVKGGHLGYFEAKCESLQNHWCCFNVVRMGVIHSEKILRLPTAEITGLSPIFFLIN